MKKIQMRDFGSSLGLRDVARKIKQDNDFVSGFFLLDFDGVDVVGNAFADELLGVFVADRGIGWLREHIKLANTNDAVAEVIRWTLKHRLGAGRTTG